VSIVPSLETSRTASVGSFKILDIYLDLKSLVSKLGFRAVPANRGRSCFCLSFFFFFLFCTANPLTTRPSTQTDRPVVRVVCLCCSGPFF